MNLSIGEFGVDLLIGSLENGIVMNWSIWFGIAIAVERVIKIMRGWKNTWWKGSG
jgi:hypothetical protein